jgi:hypothetical protein
MTATPRLGAPQVADASATPGTDCNEQCAYFDMGANAFSIADRDATAPPGSPSTTSAYIVAASPTGAWSGHAGDIAFLVNGTWTFIDVREGMIFWIEDENKFLVALSSSSFQEFTPITIDNDTTLAGDSASNVPSQHAVKTYVTNSIAGLFDLKGATDCSGNPNYPSASKGDAYRVSVAGKIGGASGTDVEIGDWYFATADNAGGTQASVGTSWATIEPGGVQSMPVLAAAMTPRTTNGPVRRAARANHDQQDHALDARLRRGDNEYAQFMFPMPKSWNESTVTAQFIWAAPGGTGNVIWGIQGVAISDDDVIDAAFGTAQDGDRRRHRDDRRDAVGVHVGDHHRRIAGGRRPGVLPGLSRRGQRQRHAERDRRQADRHPAQLHDQRRGRQLKPAPRRASYRFRSVNGAAMSLAALPMRRSPPTRRTTIRPRDRRSRRSGPTGPSSTSTPTTTATSQPLPEAATSMDGRTFMRSGRRSASTAPRRARTRTSRARPR